MNSHSTYIIALAISLGTLGGLSSHATWLIKTMRELAQSNKSLSISKKSIKARVALLLLSFGLGMIAGFVAGLITVNQNSSLSVVIASAFLAAYAFDSFVGNLGKFNVIG